MNLLAAPAVDAHGDPTLSPTGVFAVLLLALLIDFSSAGPDSLRDRVAFLFGLASVRVGWDDSALDRWTVQQLSTWIDQAKQTGNSYLAQAVTPDVIKILVGLLGLYCIGCLLPSKFSGKLGKFALLAFSGSGGAKGGGGRLGIGAHRINVRLWVCAWLLGMLADLSDGATGTAINLVVSLAVRLAGLVPNWLFGVH